VPPSPFDDAQAASKNGKIAMARNRTAANHRFVMARCLQKADGLRDERPEPSFNLVICPAFEANLNKHFSL
jgi:hypothetical protein